MLVNPHKITASSGVGGLIEWVRGYFASTIGLTASKALATNSSGQIVPSTATAAALAFVDFTSSGQTQLDANTPVGVLFIWSTAAAPTNFLICDGSSLLRTTYSDLFDVIGTTYGSVDGTHFTLPDLRGNFPRGKNADALGDTGGAATHTHPLSSAGYAKIHLNTNARIYALLQAVTAWSSTNYQAVTAPRTASLSFRSEGTALGGATDAGSTLPPYQVFNFIIRYK